MTTPTKQTENERTAEKRESKGEPFWKGLKACQGEHSYERFVFENEGKAIDAIYGRFKELYRFYDNKLVELNSGAILCNAERSDVERFLVADYMTTVNNKNGSTRSEIKSLNLQAVLDNTGTEGLYIEITETYKKPSYSLFKGKSDLSKQYETNCFNTRSKTALELTPKGENKYNIDRLMTWIKNRFETEEEYRYYLSWINKAVGCFAEPDLEWTRNRTAISLYGGQGTGKTKLADILKALLGVEHVNTLTGRGNDRFSDGLNKKPVAIIEEKPVDHENIDSRNFSQILKDLITNDVCSVEEKGKDRQKQETVCNLITTTNNPESLEVRDGDRRWSVFNIEGVVDREAEWITNNTDALKNIPNEKDREWVNSLTEEQKRECQRPAFLKELSEAAITKNPDYARQLWNAIQEELKKLSGPVNTDCVLQNAVRREQTILNSLKSGPLAAIKNILLLRGEFKTANIQRWMSCQDIERELKERYPQFYKDYDKRKIGGLLKSAPQCFISSLRSNGKYEKIRGWSLTKEAIEVLTTDGIDYPENTDEIENTPQQFIDYNHL